MQRSEKCFSPKPPQFDLSGRSKCTRQCTLKALPKFSYIMHNSTVMGMQNYYWKRDIKKVISHFHNEIGSVIFPLKIMCILRNGKNTTGLKSERIKLGPNHNIFTFV